jgi:uncharacterized protein (DUF58 family)
VPKRSCGRSSPAARCRSAFDESIPEKAADVMMFRINIRSITLYVFSLVIMYLAGVYFGTFLYVLFIMFLLLPFLSFVSFLVWVSALSCTQSLSRTSPVKGDTIEFRLEVKNRSFLPVPTARVAFAQVSEALHAELPDFEAYLPPRGTYQTSKEITCPYRGTYKIGVASIRISDQLGFFSFAKAFDPVRITVYPRILRIPRFAPVANDVEGTGRFSSAGILPDTTLFHELKEYRDGESIRHIYWKKYASTGKPYLKEYDRTKRAGVRIYLDARSANRWDVHRLEQEDASVEALVAIVRYLLSNGVHTTVVTADPLLRFSGDHAAAFDRFYESTARISFTRSLSPAALFTADHRRGLLESQTCIFITHLADPQLPSLVVGGVVYDSVIVSSRVGASRTLTAEYDRFASDVRRKGVRLVVLRSSRTIAEDLAGHVLAGSGLSYAPGSDLAVAAGGSA